MWLAARIAAIVFPVSTLLTSIPVFAVVVRYNLVNAKVLPHWAASAVSWALPWCVARHRMRRNFLFTRCGAEWRVPVAHESAH